METSSRCWYRRGYYVFRLHVVRGGLTKNWTRLQHHRNTLKSKCLSGVIISALIHPVMWLIHILWIRRRSVSECICPFCHLSFTMVLFSFYYLIFILACQVGQSLSFIRCRRLTKVIHLINPRLDLYRSSDHNYCQFQGKNSLIYMYEITVCCIYRKILQKKSPRRGFLYAILASLSGRIHPLLLLLRHIIKRKCVSEYISPFHHL